MKFIAAHKIMFMVGAVLVGGVVLYLRHRSSSSSSGAAAQGSLSPDYGGVATSPYNDSGAPQFSFDLGSLLPSGPGAPVTSTSTPAPAAPPPNKVPGGGIKQPPPQAPGQKTPVGIPRGGGPERNPGLPGSPVPKVSLPTKPTFVPDGMGSSGTPLAIQTTTTGQQFQVGGGGRRPV